jgi:hypothetical protein
MISKRASDGVLLFRHVVKIPNKCKHITTHSEKMRLAAFLVSFQLAVYGGFFFLIQLIKNIQILTDK